ncbi:MAG: dephospho-CoA kinase [Solobacterium sp.]|nr:dephospho-CoA kinase [Solobacterium sp.]
MRTAVTGTIGAGKSTLSILLRRRGYAVFDSDGYARMALNANQPTAQKVIAAFGEGILDDFGEIDRKKLAAEVFGNEEKRQTLNGIVHPFVKEGLEKFFALHEDDHFVFAEVPLLFEAGWENMFDHVIVVTCGHETAVQRMMEDRGYSREEAEARIASQINAEEQIRRADTVFMNDGNFRDLDNKTAAWLKQYGEE